MTIPKCFDDVANILSILDKKKSALSILVKEEPATHYVAVGRWSQCANCGVIFQRNQNRKVGIYTVSEGIYHEIQKPDDPEHWCGAPWQTDRPHDIPVEWIPGVSPLMKQAPDAPYETVEVIS